MAAFSIGDLTGRANALAGHYRAFRVAERSLLTGHSHQAWPDVAQEGLAEAWRDAASLVDAKWGRAEDKARAVRRGYARLMDDPEGDYALGSSTHDLLVRLLSALPLAERPRIVTTDGEFLSARRQLARLEEEGLEVVRVPARPGAEVGERLAAAVDDRAAAAFVSTVFYGNAEIAGGLGVLAERCRRHGVALVLDVYHQLAAVPFSLRRMGLEDAFAVGGGYKYCQLGEGNAFLRMPPGCRLRPVVTGWFAEFGDLGRGGAPGEVGYADGPARFAGATYDPVSHYRAAAVFAFFDRNGLDPVLLRAVSRHQVARLAERFDELDLDPAVVGRDRTLPLERTGGFLALTSPRAGELAEGLRRREVLTDSRGSTLRLGPAPYLRDDQLDQAIAALGEVAGR